MRFFGLWFKTEKTYPVPQIDNIHTIVGAVNFLFMIGTGYLSDKIGNRGPICLGGGIILAFCYTVLTVWGVPDGLIMVVFCR